MSNGRKPRGGSPGRRTSDRRRAPSAARTGSGHSTRVNGAVTAAALLPLALGISAGLNPNALSVAAPPTSVDAAALEPAALIAADKAIARAGINNPASEVLETWSKPAPNKSKLGSCGWYGSEGADKETNLRKNRTDLPTQYHTVEFSALTDLQWPREASTRRDRWTSDQLKVIAPYEGEAITVTGFIVALRPQANNSEATNCGEGGEDNTDWHIALVGEFGDKEPEAVVVETTPRIKRHHPNWAPEKLKPYVGQPDSVRVSGYLLFDPVHKGHLGKYRKTLWEIHPIHRIEVWHGGRWADLDDLP
jgi:hypothetical protein